MVNKYINIWFSKSAPTCLWDLWIYSDKEGLSLKVYKNEEWKSFAIKNTPSLANINDSIAVYRGEFAPAFLEHLWIKETASDIEAILLYDVVKNSWVSITSDLVINNSVTFLKLYEVEGTQIAGESLQLNYTVLPATASPEDYWFESSDESIATVNEEGLVTFHTRGTVKITLQSKSGLASSISIDILEYGEFITADALDSFLMTKDNEVFKVIMEDVQYEDITSAKFVQKSYGELSPGTQVQLEYKITPSDYDRSRISFRSSNPEVAEVNIVGTVTVKTRGVFSIDLLIDGIVKDTLRLSSIGITSIELINPNLDEYIKGTTLQLDLKVTPVNADRSFISFESSNPEVIAVSSEGVLSFIADGKATITASTPNGLSSSLTFEISEFKAIKSIQLTATETDVEVGRTQSVSAVINPSSGYNPNTLSWKSSNTSIATVTPNGIVTMKALGAVTITLEATNGVHGSIVLNGVGINELYFINKDYGEVVYRDNFKLEYYAGPSRFVSSSTITLTSSNPSIATVDWQGNVVCVGWGSVTFTLRSNTGLSATKTINIARYHLVRSISIKDSDLTLELNKSRTLDYEILPSDYDPASISWVSSNNSVAFVSAGVVTARTLGEASITLQSTNGVKDSIKVTTWQAEEFYTSDYDNCQLYDSSNEAFLVREFVDSSVPITSAKFDSYSYGELSVGSEVKLKYTVTPSDYDRSLLTFDSSNPSVMKVTKVGVVTVLSRGLSTINMYTLNGGNKVLVDSIQLSSVGITSVKFTESPIYYGEIVKGSEFDLKYQILPESADRNFVSFTSSNTTIATVSNTGHVIFKGYGQVTFTIKSTNGHQDSITLLASQYPSIKSVEIVTQDQNLQFGKTLQLAYNITPSGYDPLAISWSSNNSNVTVSNTGFVTAKALGTSVVTLSSNNGHSDSITINVVGITSVAITPKTFGELVKGSSIQLTCHAEPEEYVSNSTITWSSSNTSIATVSQTGLVTFIGYGDVTITVKSDTGKSDSVSLHILEYPTIKGVSISEKELELEIGKTYTLNYSINPSTGYRPSDIGWRSDNSCVTVNNGVITANSFGTATVTLYSVNGHSSSVIVRCYQTEEFYTSDYDECQLYDSNAQVFKVREFDDSTVQVTSAKFSNKNYGELSVNQVLDLEYQVSPDNYDRGLVRFSSSNTGVMTVTKSGKVTVSSIGLATISLEVNKNGVWTTFDSVSLSSIGITSVAINSKTFGELVKGGSIQLDYIITPDLSLSGRGGFTSSNTSIATVSQTGFVNFVGYGNVTITLSTLNGHSDSVTLNILEYPSIKSIDITTASQDLQFGKTLQLYYAVLPAGYNSRNLSWNSSNSSIATVNSSGLVTAKALGTATITLSGEGKSDSITISVVGITSVSITSKTFGELVKGGSIQLSYTAEPSAYANSSTLSFKSSNTSIATVSNTGLVNFVGFGNVRITLTSDTGKSDYVDLTILEYPTVKGVSISESEIELEIGKSYNLSYSITPSSGYNPKDISWTSSNACVTVSNGVVKSVSLGTSTIKLKSTNGHEASVIVKCYQPVEFLTSDYDDCQLYDSSNEVFKVREFDNSVVKITSASFDEINYGELSVGQVIDLQYTVNPTDYDRGLLKFTSSDESIMTVTKSGRVTVVKIGVVTISMLVSNNGVWSKVDEINLSSIGITSVAITSEPPEEIVSGDSIQLAYSITPNLNLSGRGEFKSSNTSIATVSQTGRVTFVKAGTVTITLSTLNGHSDSIVLTALQYATIKSVDITTASQDLQFGKTLQLAYSVNPSSRYDTSALSWKSSNTSIATVSTTGLVTAKALGTSTITLQSSNGKSDSITVTVVGIESVSITSKSFGELVKGGSIQLRYTASPDKYVNSSTLRFESSNTSIATVNSTGLVNFVGFGTVRITLISDTGKSDYVDLNILEYPTIKGLSINENEIELEVGKVRTLNYTITPASGYRPSDVSWSSNNSCVTVSNGVITAKSLGTAVVTLSSVNGHSSSVTVRCFNYENFYTSDYDDCQLLDANNNAFQIKEFDDSSIPVSSAKFSKYSYGELSVGQELDLEYEVSPSNYDRSLVRFISSNTGVMTVTKSGKVSVVGVGLANITLQINSGGSWTNADVVSLSSIGITSVAITSKTFGELVKGGSVQLTYTITPNLSLSGRGEFRSSNTSIATVNSSGLVSFVGYGNVTITLFTYNGLSDSVTLNILQYPTIKSIDITTSSQNLQFGKTLQLAYSVSPSGYNPNSLSWRSSNTSVASVSSSGLVTAKAVGTATITLSGEGKSDSITINVVGITSVAITSKTFGELVKGGSTQLTYTITPSQFNSSSYYKFTSSNTSIATVNSSGLVSFVGYGNVRITLTSDTGKSDYVDLSIRQYPKVTNITIGTKSQDLQVGKSLGLLYLVTPTGYNSNDIAITSSDSSVVSITNVMGTNKLTALKQGTAIITVKSIETGISKSITIKVFDYVSLMDSTGQTVNTNTGDEYLVIEY